MSRVLAAYPVPDQEAWRTTVNLARIDTPNQAANQIPALAEAWLDIRFPAEDPDLNGKTAGQVTAHLATFCEPGVTAVVDIADPPHRADTHRPEMQTPGRRRRSQGYTGEFLRKHGSRDARFYDLHGITSVAFGIGGDGQHGPGEYADITTLRPYYQALTDFLLGPGV